MWDTSCYFGVSDRYFDKVVLFFKSPGKMAAYVGPAESGEEAEAVFQEYFLPPEDLDKLKKREAEIKNPAAPMPDL